MGGLLLLVFIVVPILEIVVFIQAGKWIGLWPTVAGVVMTALIGVALVRHQGFAVLRNAQSSLGEGRFPAAEVFDGLCLVLAGGLLVLPGFLTDAVGFLLLVPPLRTFLRRILGNRMLASGRVQVWSDAPPAPRPPPHPSSPRPSPPSGGRGGIIIDADYEHVPEEPPAERPEPPERQVPDERQAPGEKGPERRGGSPWRKDGVKGDAKDDAKDGDGKTNGR